MAAENGTMKRKKAVAAAPGGRCAITGVGLVFAFRTP